MFDDFVIVVPGGELVHFFFTPQDATSGILQWCKRIVLLPKISGFNRSTIYNWWILVDFPGMSVDRMVDRFWIPGHGSRIYRNTLKWCPALQEGPPQRCWLVSVGFCWFLLVYVNVTRKFYQPLIGIQRNPTDIVLLNQQKTIVWAPMQAPSCSICSICSYRYSNCSWTAELSPP